MKRTRVEVDHKQLENELLFGAAFFAGAVALHLSKALPAPISLVILVGCTAIGAFSFLKAFLKSGSAPCPLCDAPISGLSLWSTPVLICLGCKRHLLQDGRELEAMPEDALLSTPTFWAPVREKTEWPEGCACCGERATHREKIQAEWREDVTNEGRQFAVVGLVLAVTGGSFAFVPGRRFKVTTYSRDVPHCGRCAGGASLGCIGASSLGIRFRSYAYWKKFVRLNQR
jgi:hypothetical protein